MKNDEIGVTVGTTVLQAAGYSISGRERLAGKDTAADIPLVIAIPGGTYTSRYFDVPGYSLLDHAAVSGIPVIAIDRPGYGNSTPLPPPESTIAGNAEQLDDAIGQIWKRAGNGASGIVLIGHSIGGAVTVEIASRRPSMAAAGDSRFRSWSSDAAQRRRDLCCITRHPDDRVAIPG